MNYLILLNVEMPGAATHEREEVLRQLAERGWRPLLDGVSVLSKVIIASCSASALRIAHYTVRMTATRTGVRLVANLRCVEERADVATSSPGRISSSTLVLGGFGRGEVVS